MHGIEHFRQLDPDRCQIINVEKAAVIDFLGRDAPKRQPIRLRVQQFVQFVEAAWIPALSVDLRQCLFNRLLDPRRFFATALETPLDDFFFTSAFCDPFRIGFRAFRQIFERGQNALQLGVKIFLLVLGEILQRDFQDVTICAGRDWQSAFAIEQVKRPFLKADLQFAALKNAPVLVAQNWQQDLVAQIRL